MPSSNRQRSQDGPTPTQLKAAKKSAQSAAKTFERKWRQLQTICPDPDSQHRLTWLQQQFAKGQRRSMESAQVEIDIAVLLADAGFTLSFVKETETRTADLECYFEHDRLFVEVTVIVPTESERSKDVRAHHATNAEDESLDFWKDGLVKRMLARMREKAVQLANYCAPVILAMTLVYQEQSVSANGKSRKLDLDLQQLGGVMTNALASIPQVSGVLLTLWNIQTAESRSTIRLSNVHIGEWVANQKGYSQVRCLALNPAASYPIESGVQAAFQRVL